MDIATKIAKVQELLPQMKDPEKIARAQQFLSSHGVEQRTGMIGSGTGSQVEGIEGSMGAQPSQELVTASMPETPGLGEYLGRDAARRMAAVALGFDKGLTGGIGHHLMTSNLTGPIDRALGLPGVEKETAKSAQNVEELSKEHPGLEAMGSIASLKFGGLPALIDSAVGKGLAKVGLRVAESAAPAAALPATRVGEVVEKGGQAASATLPSMLRGALRGVGTALGMGAVEDIADAADNALREKPVDMSNEGEKMVIRMMLGGTMGVLGGALSARAAANRDPLTNAGSAGTAQQLAKIERMKGGGVGLGGVEVPEKLQPLYAEAMAGGTESPKGLNAPVIAEGPHEPGPVGEMFRGEELPPVTRPGMAVQDVAAEKALIPVQKGIDETQTVTMAKIRNAQDRFLNSSAQHQQVEPTEISDVLKKYIHQRTFKDGAPVPYANSVEPITELNKLFVTGDPVSSAESAAAVARNPGSLRMKAGDAAKLGLKVPPGDPTIEGGEPWVVIEPRKVNPAQFESAMQGINKAAAESKVPDALHADLQQAGFKVRQKFEWPADAGPKPPPVIVGNRATGQDTVTGWAAVQARAHELMSETEKNLYRLGTNPAEATGETRGADAILNSLRAMGRPGRNRADDALYNLGKNQPGGREALQNMEAVNLIEGPGGLRSKTEFTGGLFDVLRAHNRHAAGLRLDPTMQVLGSGLPRVGGAVQLPPEKRAPEDDKAVIKRLLGGFMP